MASEAKVYELGASQHFWPSAIKADISPQQILVKARLLAESRQKLTFRN